MTDCENIAKESPKWFVMNAYKAERRAEEELQNDNRFNVFIAKRYAIRTRHGKQMRELTPVIPNIIFVHASYSDIDQFQSQRPYLNFATFQENGQRRIMTVPDRQMQNFIGIARQVEEEIIYFRPEEVNLSKGTRVKVIGGMFDGIEATLLKVKGKRSKRIVVLIDGIAAVAATEIEPHLLQILP